VLLNLLETYFFPSLFALFSGEQADFSAVVAADLRKSSRRNLRTLQWKGRATMFAFRKRHKESCLLVTMAQLCRANGSFI